MNVINNISISSDTSMNVNGIFKENLEQKNSLAQNNKLTNIKWDYQTPFLMDTKFQLAEYNILHFNVDKNKKYFFSNTLFLMIRERSTQDLTNREIEVASLWINGYSLKESAKLLGITSRTIEEYRARTKDKLNVKDKKEFCNLAREQQTVIIYMLIAKNIKEGV